MMAEIITFRVDGLQDLGRRMKSLADVTAKKYAGRATGSAAGIVKEAAKQNLRRPPRRVDTGLLEKHVISKKLPKTKTELTSEHIVTVKRAIYQRTATERIATRKVGSLVEFGTIFMEANPFIRNALSANIQEAIEAMRRSLAKDLDRGGA